MLRPAGDAVESPDDRLWHVALDAVTTFCGLDCDGWESVPNAVDRGGIWCGGCLARIAKLDT